MDNLVIEAAEKTPGIILEKGKLEFHGRSIVDDPKRFFDPVMSWIQHYMSDPADETAFTIKLDYIDSQSTQVLYQIIEQLRSLEDKQFKFFVNWYYTYGDIEMLELGEIIQGRLNMQFRFYEFSAKTL